MGATQPRAIKSAERTLALFELFSKVQAPLTAKQVTQELAIPQPSASMLLHNLVDLGYLEHDRTLRTYAPSIRVVLLGSWINRRFGEAQSLAERLDVLQRQVKETAYIAIQNGPRGQYVMSQASDSPNSLNVSSGQYRSLTCTAFGRALLALKPDWEIATWVRRCNAEAEEERFKIRHRDFMKIIADVRRKGYGETRGEQTPGQGAISMTFPSPIGDMWLAVGTGGPIRRIQRKRAQILKSLQEFRQMFARQPD
jgi:DNA-binding IclR family transcriptional regulator